MKAFRRLLEQVEKANRRYRLFRKGDSLVLGVSGGPDSVALLALLSKMRRKYGFRIVVAHLNHGLQQKPAARCQALVRRMAAGLKLPFYKKNVRLKTLAARHKRSVEEMGRLERYLFFEEIAKKVSATKIVTAHTLDDQAETVLMRMIRGSGLRGLGGIPCRRKQGRFEVVRPLILCQKSEILSFLRESRLPYCVDPTNRDTIFTRNRVRRHLLPWIARRMNPQIKQVLSSLQEICSRTQDYVDRQSARAFKACLRRAPSGRVLLDLKGLKRLHPALLNEVLLSALVKKKGDSRRLAYSHLAAIEELLCSEKGDLRLDLPGPVRVRKSRRFLVIESGRNSERLH